MIHFEKKQIGAFPFSYIDIFFLLLVVLLLSFGIGFLAEERRENKAESYQVYLYAELEENLKHAIPAEGDVIFTEEGLPGGRVLLVYTEEQSNQKFLHIKCRLDGEKPLVGDVLTVETAGSIRAMQVYVVESADSE